MTGWNKATRSSIGTQTPVASGLARTILGPSVGDPHPNGPSGAGSREHAWASWSAPFCWVQGATGGMGLGRVGPNAEERLVRPLSLPFTGTLMNTLRIYDEAVATPGNLRR